MKTKQLFRMMTVVLCAMLMSSLMTSCNSKNNPEDSTGKKAAFMQFSFATTDEMMQIFDFNVEYYDENGSLKNDKLTEAAWSKRINSSSLPAKFGFRVKLEMKKNVSLPGDKKVLISYSHSYTSSAMDADHKAVGDLKRGSSDVESEIKSTQVEGWAKEHAAKPLIQVAFDYDANGNANNGQW